MYIFIVVIAIVESSLAIFSKAGDSLSDNLVNSISMYTLDTISLMHMRHIIMLIAGLFLKAKIGNNIIALQ